MAVTIIRDIPYAEGRALDLYFPEGVASCPVLTFFFGGGLEAGCRQDLSEMGREFAEAGIAVVAPDYRLYPAVQYPAFIEDAAEAAAWVSANIARYVRPQGLFIGGYSAGAYLSMMLCFDPRYLARHGLDADRFAGYIHLSGQPTTHFNVLKYRGEDSRKIVVDEAAPIRYARSHGAPMLLIVASDDIPGRLEQNQLLKATLGHFEYDAPVEWMVADGANHGQLLDKNGDGISPLLAAAGPFVRRMTKAGLSH